MERMSRSAIAAPARAGWNDMDSWAALTELRQALQSDTGPTMDSDVLAIEWGGGGDGPFVAAIGPEGYYSHREWQLGSGNSQGQRAAG